MPSFSVASVKSAAISAKNKASSSIGDFRDKHSSASNYPTRPSVPSRSSPSLPPRSSPSLPPRSPPSLPPRSAPSQRKQPPPPPPPRRAGTGTSSEIISRTQSIAESEEDVYYDARNTSVEEEVEIEIEWASLSLEDKETFFAWLDEFFANYIRGLSKSPSPASYFTPSPASSSSSLPAPAVSRPHLPPRRPTNDAAPAVASRFNASSPVLPTRTRPDLSANHRTESEPAPTPRRLPPPARAQDKQPVHVKPSEKLPPPPPPINYATRPDVPTFEEEYTPEPAPSESLGECIRCRDYTAMDEHASHFPREHVTSIEALAYDLTSPFPVAIDKVRAITFWLHLNITYDAEAFLTHNVKPSTPDSTLRSGMAVCEGYGGLFAALALAAGLECIVVTGHGKGFGYAPLAPGAPVPPYSAGHAWNAVRLDDGAWKLVDSCWAGGALDASGVFTRRFDSFHFMATNEEFGRRHFPDPREPWKQFVEPLVSWEEYIGAEEDSPTVTGTFLQGEYASHLLYPATRIIQKGTHTFYVKKKCEHVREREQEEYVHVVMGPLMAQDRTPGRGGWLPMTLDPVNGGWRFDGLRVVSGEKVMVAIVTKVGEKDARGLGKAAYERAMGKQGMAFEVLVQWEVE
ncbi:hypothetical protein DENSPDRAFT_842493 [Dentipellis sp. KUC8613]|nr:hypothetical protein DENSPDRAFT_842493 [Dentipellis sp. KUC8613]